MPRFALALIVHATILVVTTIGGGIAFVRLGWRRAADPGDVANPEPGEA